MTARGVLITVGLGLGAWSTVAQGTLPEPSEAPPAGFAAEAYVDSAGCGFLRVVVGEDLIWAPRYRADGTQLCGLLPSFAGHSTLSDPPPDPADGPAAPTVSAGQAGPDPSEAAEPASERTRPPGFYVQAGAFGLRENAFGVRDGFLAQGWGAETQPAGRLTAVFAGPFADADAAQAALGLIRRQGMPDAFVFRQD